MNTDVMFSSKSNEWGTPINLFNKLNSKFNFTLDPCCTINNKKCEKYFTIETNGLNQSWKDEIVFCNPPYGRQIGKWVAKAYNECTKFGTTIVMLIPSRTDTKWFHSYIYNKFQIMFIAGRLKFENEDNTNLKLMPAPFPSMLVLFSNPSNNLTLE